MKRAIRILPWVAIVALLTMAFGPITNSIQRVSPWVSNSPAVINIAVSPTALATTVNITDLQRYDYTLYAQATAGAFGCCSYGVGNGTPAATPQVSGSACSTGMYISPGTYLLEDTSPQQSLECVTSGGTLNFSVKNDD